MLFVVRKGVLVGFAWGGSGAGVPMQPWARARLLLVLLRVRLIRVWWVLSVDITVLVEFLVCQVLL